VARKKVPQNKRRSKKHVDEALHVEASAAPQAAALTPMELPTTPSPPIEFATPALQEKKAIDSGLAASSEPVSVPVSVPVIAELPDEAVLANNGETTGPATIYVAPTRTTSRPLARIRTTVRWVFKWSLRVFLVTLPIWLIAAYLAWQEMRNSHWQAKYLTKIAQESTFTVEDGPNPTPWFPSYGPYDSRLGYTRINAIAENLTRNGYSVTRQTRLSPRFLELTKMGIYPPYREKTRTGITILDRQSTTLYSAYRPERVYDTFEMVPKSIIDSLLYIENREILDQTYPRKNPAIEWDRLALAVLEKARQIIQPNLNAPGGSTIATQLEKYRHSNEGRTSGIRDKLLQMGSASIHAYMYGEETLETRKLIVLQYINSIPLAALPGYGEVNGLGDGLWAWYGLDFDEINQKLTALSQLKGNQDPTPYAEAYKQMLSLFIAHRRPSFYLLKGLSELDALTNTHLDLFANDGIISRSLRDAAKKYKLTLRRAAPKAAPISFVQLKAANAIRTRLLSLMKYPQLYDLDQVDLTVKSSMDNEANAAVTSVLRQIKTAENVKKLGLSGARNLSRGDPSKVIYSLTLYERVANSNLLRVQTDNFDEPFSINEGTRLDLGSTAKLRTVTTYLDIVGELFDKYKGQKSGQLRTSLASGLDPISLFVASSIASEPNITLVELLDRAMERRYAASTSERFFTGGGVHTFKNFKRADDGRVPTLQEALTNSLNLPMIRLMRDISRYYQHKLGVSLDSAKEKRNAPMRLRFLQKFADQEGSQFMRRFAKKYSNQKPSEMLAALIKDSRASPKHAAVMYRYVRPTGTVEQMASFLRDTVKSANVSLGLVDSWYNDYAPGKFSLNDQGYLARVHPLELWLVKYMQDNPDSTTSEALKASAAERQEVYQWLFKTPHARAQDSRIRTLIEMEAFLEIHKQWRKMGYPFNSMVPSLASSIGSSGDRPAALAELVGIILSDGIRNPLVRLENLHFASGTPFETVIRRNDNAPGERVLKPEVAQTLKKAMSLVVEKGTARRVYGTFVRSDGKAYVIGGKTGTGDHRHETYGPGGGLIASRVVNRTATFAFFIGDRFFGVISAHVPGAEAAKFDFTSALAAELLKILAKSLVPMIEESGSGLSPLPEIISAEATKEENAEKVTTPVQAKKSDPATNKPQAPSIEKPKGEEKLATSVPAKPARTPKPLPVVLAPPA
jgi:membrane peptidoglycan carboxypeptidase